MTHTMTETRYRIFETPTGPFALIERGPGDLAATWTALDDVPSHARPDPTMLPELSARLECYFAGDPVVFDDVPTPQGPPFHRLCWDACRAIEPGHTMTYGELADRAGNSSAARAAGQAMRRNPLPVIVPCHRVIGSGGDLYAYSGSRDPAGRELGIKRYLLELEG